MLSNSIESVRANLRRGSDRDELDRLMIDKRVGVYVGVDPTAPSLHVGHLLPLMSMFWMYVKGFHGVSLVSLINCLLRFALTPGTARRFDSANRRSYRQDNLSRADALQHSEGQHGQHALPAENALGKYGAPCSLQARVPIRVGMAQRAGEQQYMDE